MNEAAQSFKIKGVGDGLLVSLGDGTWQEASQRLLQRIEEQAGFYRGAKLALEIGDRAVGVNPAAELRESLSAHGVLLWAIVSSNPESEKAAQLLGLATRVSRPRPAEELGGPPVESDSAYYLKHTVRSGTRLRYSGSVVLFGDVNAGGEIIADGDIIVWGRIRGVVHAGAAGATDVVVCALELSPTRLQIADQVSELTDRERTPCMVHLKNGRLAFLEWGAAKEDG